MQCTPITISMATQPTTSSQTSGGDAKADDFQQESTFVKMMLEEIAKTDNFRFKKLS